MFRIVEASPGQRAKISVESLSAFDVESRSEHILGGFRSRAFGAQEVTSPRDYLNSAEAPRGRRLCAALQLWAKFYDVRPEAVHFYIFDKPTKISVFPEYLSGLPSPESSLTWTLAAQCRNAAISSGFNRRVYELRRR
jgi:hypothetical protein